LALIDAAQLPSSALVASGLPSHQKSTVCERQTPLSVV
jgi:hypothetical protein